MPAPAPLLDPGGHPVALAPPPIAVGGEGAIYAVAGSPDLVAKVYNRPPTLEHAAKLRAMADLATPALLKVAAWPTATLHPGSGASVAGVLMPRVVGSREVHHLYSVAQRKKDFPAADWRFLVHAARNCALAFEAVHAAGHVVGDVNQKNLLVAPDAIVRFVDCDSFQICGPSGEVFRCAVGVPEFTPPELQGVSFRDVDRTPEHDRFGLAVLIFHLLMMGRHPFAGVYAGSGDMPLERAIETGRYAYGRGAAAAEMSPPPNTPPAAILAGGPAALFERAFAVPEPAGASRPAPAEWVEALSALLDRLVPCPVDPRHVFPRDLGPCPWCQLIGTAGVLFFLPGPGPGAVGDPAFDLAAVWAEVARFTSADFRYVRPDPTPGPDPIGEPVPPALGTPTPQPPPAALPVIPYDFEGLAALGMIASLLLLCCAWKVALAALAGSTLWLLGLVATRSGRRARALGRYLAHLQAVEDWEHENRRWLKEFRKRQARLDHARNRLVNLEEQHQERTTAALAEFTGLREPLQVAKARLDDQARKHQVKRQALVRDAARLQRDQHLDSVLIADHRIAGISSARLANLRSFGIETALDVARLATVKVPQIGPKLTERLVEWRDEQAESFRFDPTRPSRELQALDRNHRALTRQWEADLLAGPAQLDALTGRFRLQSRSATRQIQKMVDQIRQAERDVEIMERMLT